MRHWRESAFIRWTCLFLGLAVVLGALAQLGAFVVVGYLGALFHDGSVADGSLGRNATPVGGLDFVFRLGPAWQLLLLAPIILAIIILAATGVGTLLAALNVAYRDFRYVIPFLVQLWMFATPSVYMQPGQDSSGERPPRRVSCEEGAGILLSAGGSS